MSENVNIQLNPVEFHGDIIYCVEYEGQPYTPVKPIVENLGLSWGTQGPKLSDNRDRYGYLLIKIPTGGGVQEMGCIPVRKLTAFLYSINANRVREDLRPKLIQYQEECDEVLWQYWSTGQASRESVRNTVYTLDDKMAAAQRILGVAQITGNQLALALDNVYRANTGQSALAESGVQLIAPRKEVMVTPTQIGTELNPPLSAKTVNLLLAGAGYQYKTEGGWQPTEKAEGMYEFLDTHKRHKHDGTPVRQLKWYVGIVDIVRSLMEQSAKDSSIASYDE